MTIPGVGQITVKGDRIIWLTVVLLSVFSVLLIYSSTELPALRTRDGNTEYYLFKHLAILIFGLVCMYFAHLIDYKYYSKLAQLLLYISIPLLFITLVSGHEVSNARRWINVPIINLTFQTSDLAKLALIMYTARGLSKIQSAEQDFKSTFLPLLIPVIIICALIAPADLSTAIMLFATSIVLMFIGRVKLKYLGGLAGVTLAGAAFMVLLLFTLPDQMMVGRMSTWKKRIETFINPELGSGATYQVEKAKIAIATSGVLLGKGPGNSVQKSYLPNSFSDDIFAIIIEEYGILGGVIVIFLYLLLLYRCIKIVLKAPKAFGALLAVGLGFSLAFQAMLNMAVVVDLLPVTGLPLPLLSMGGTSIWFTSISIGIILSVSKNIEEEQAQSATQNEPA